MRRDWWIVPAAVLIIGIILAVCLIWMYFGVRQITDNALAPVSLANQQLKTEVARILNPTPTIIPDPITIIHEVRSLARLETIQYTVEKVITAETGQGQFGVLFGDKLLFVAHGIVIAGIDLQKLNPEDIRLDGKVLYVRLPEAEVFIATLDNEQSYVYNRETGILSKGQKDLETQARQAAEQEILKAALEDGILKMAQQNGESYLSRMLRYLGYEEVIFTNSVSTPTPTP